MMDNSFSDSLDVSIEKTTTYLPLFRYFLYGLLLPLSFAPFHQPIAAILSLALFYHELKKHSASTAFWGGMMYGLGFFGFGVSWVFVSINHYGHLNYVLSALITLLFLFYLSLFPALAAFAFAKLKTAIRPCWYPLLFSCIWVLSECLRSQLFTGFPWLTLGIGQFDNPFFNPLLPIIGVYGLSLISALLATYLLRWRVLIPVSSLLLIFALYFQPAWVHLDKKPVSVAVIQANISMRDKWDEHLFWQLLEHYETQIHALLGKTQLVVLPESAIPLPTSYLREFFTDLQAKANQSNTAIILGIPQPTSINEDNYYNAMISLGAGKGNYLKQHLVPFGEYIPALFQPILQWLAIPDANLQSGEALQKLIRVQHHPIASLICYELAYGNLLRQQLPQAQWIVSISDDGWFGHSLAMYQQLQIAQVRSLQAGRYQVVSNNDGLSAIIDAQGKITDKLGAFTAGILQAKVFPATGMTPWVKWGDWPILLLCSLFLTWALGQRYLSYKKKST